jgi:WD40 repeat protein
MSTERLVISTLIDAENPWPGLSSFDEAAQRFFSGRDAESAELLRLVGQAPLTVLFGKSGLGKTSLVQAGLFPRLRQQNILPIYVRLNVRDRSAPLIQQAAAALQAEVSKHGVDIAAPNARESLWEHLHDRHVEWWSAKNQPLTPVFVFDQFEEAFTLGAENAEAIEQLRLDLSDLIENRIPVDLGQRIEESASAEHLDLRGQRYKMLLSFREDFLPEVEGWKGELPSLMRNRVRLLPMSADRALQVVSGNTPAGKTHELVGDDTARKIVRFVAAVQTKDEKIGRGTSLGKVSAPLWDKLELEPALLSLVCEGLNEKRKARAHATIDAALLDETGNAIIGDFYQRCVAEVPEKTRRFIEDALITEGGFRNSYPLQDALDQGQLTEPLLRQLVDRRLLRIDHQLGADRVELIHDRLTDVVREERDRERARVRTLQQRRRQRLTGAVVVVLLAIGGLFFYLWLSAKNAGEQTRIALISATALKLAIESKSILEGSLPGGTPLGLRLALAAFRLTPGPNTIGAIQTAENLSASMLWIRDSNGALAYSSNGNRIVSMSPDGVIRVRNAATGALFGKPFTVRQGGKILCIAISPNGELIVSGHEDGTMQMWDANSGQPVGSRIAAHSRAVYTVAFSYDGTRIVSGSTDTTLRIWDTSTRSTLMTLREGHSGGIIASVAWNPDGRQIVSGSLDHTLRRWDASSGQRLDPLARTDGEVVSVAFSRDGKRIVSGGYDRSVRLWDAVTGHQILTEGFQGHTDGVQSVAFSPDGKRIVSGSWDDSIRVWDANNGHGIGEPLKGHTDKVWNVSFSADGQHIMSNSADGTLRLWNAVIGGPLTGHTDEVTSVAFTADGKRVISAGYDRTVRIWDAMTGLQVGEPRYETEPITSIALSPDGERIAVGGLSGTVLLRHSVTGELLSHSPKLHSRQVSSLMFSPDGRYLASGSWDATVRLWDGRTGVPIGSALPQDSAIFGLAFSPDDGKRIVSGSWSGTILMQDVATGKMLGIPRKEHAGVISSVAFSPDGKRFVSGGHDTTLRLWDGATAVPLGEPLKGHSRQVTSVAFSADGKRIVSGAHDQTLRLWDAITGSPLGEPLRGHQNAIYSVAFSPDGKRIVSGSADTNVRMWRVGEPENVCARLDRNLSDAEWKRFVGDISYVKQCPGLPVPSN